MWLAQARPVKDSIEKDRLRDVLSQLLVCALGLGVDRMRHTIPYPNELVQHPLIGQLGTHWRHPVSGSIEDDQTIDLFRRFDISILWKTGRMVSLQEIRKFLLEVSYVTRLEDIPLLRHLCLISLGLNRKPVEMSSGLKKSRKWVYHPLAACQLGIEDMHLRGRYHEQRRLTPLTKRRPQSV